jgi:GAF domain-containing protein
MKTHLSYTLLNVVQRLSGPPQQTFSKVAARFSAGFELEPTLPTPDHVVARLETVFEALSELSGQPDVASALDLACDTLQAELPAAAVAAGLYDIDADEVRIVAARGLEHERLRGTAMPRTRCFAGHALHEPIVASGGPGGADWLGPGEEGSRVLLSPIAHDGHLLGVLALADPLCAAHFNPDDLELVSYVAGQLATFMQHHRQGARAEQRAG